LRHDNVINASSFDELQDSLRKKFRPEAISDQKSYHEQDYQRKNGNIIWAELGRVARWVLKPKIPNWVNIVGSCNGRCWYILWPFGLSYVNLVFLLPFGICILCLCIWYIFPLLVEKSGNPGIRCGEQNWRSHFGSPFRKIWRHFFDKRNDEGLLYITRDALESGHCAQVFKWSRNRATRFG
jgi:hypothetical protein